MRSALAGLCGLLAALLLPLAMVSVWLHTVVADTDAYLDRVVPLAAEERVRDAVEGLLLEGVEQQVDLTAVGELLQSSIEVPELDLPVDLPGDLDEQLEELRDQVAPLLEEAGGDPAAAAAELVRRVVTAVVDSDAFAVLWRATQEAGHTEVVSVLGSPDPLPAGEPVVIPLDTFVDAVQDQLAGLLPGLGPQLEQALDGLSLALPLVPADDLEPARVAYRLLEPLWLLLPVAAGALALLAVGLARRRLRMLAVLGGLTSVLCLALLAAMGVGRRLLLGESPSESARLVTGRIADAVGAPLREAATTGVLVGVAVLVGAALLGLAVRGVRRAAG